MFGLTQVLVHHLFFLKIAWLFIYVYEYFAYTYVYILCMCSWKPEEGIGYSRNYRYKLFLLPMWVLETEPGISRRATSPN